MPSGVPSYPVFTRTNGEQCHYDTECEGNPFFLSDGESQRRRRMRSTRNRELLENSNNRRTKSKTAKSEYPSSQPSSNPTSEPTWVLRKAYRSLWWSPFHRSLLNFTPVSTDWNLVESQVVPLRQNLVVRCVFLASNTIFFISFYWNDFFILQPSDEPSLLPSDEPSLLPSDEPSRQVINFLEKSNSLTMPNLYYSSNYILRIFSRLMSPAAALLTNHRWLWVYPLSEGDTL